MKIYIHYIITFVSSANIPTPAIVADVIYKKLFKRKVVPSSYPWEGERQFSTQLTYY